MPTIVLTAKTLSDSEMETIEGRVEQVIQKNGLDQAPLLADLQATIAGIEAHVPEARGMENP